LDTLVLPRERARRSGAVLGTFDCFGPRCDNC
jgi:hypothetical protein